MTTFDLLSDDFREECYETLLRMLSKSVNKQITMIEALVIKDAFQLGIKKVGVYEFTD